MWGGGSWLHQKVVCYAHSSTRATTSLIKHPTVTVNTCLYFTVNPTFSYSITVNEWVSKVHVWEIMSYICYFLPTFTSSYLKFPFFYSESSILTSGIFNTHMNILIKFSFSKSSFWNLNSSYWSYGFQITDSKRLFHFFYQNYIQTTVNQTKPNL